MDLALALVEEDLGRDLALQVARTLVMFMRRPGGQSQFSTVLESQAAERKPCAIWRCGWRSIRRTICRWKRWRRE